MATTAQVLANQQNAQSSTGPRTAEGKQKSAANSTKHGLSSAFTVLPHEDQDEFTALLEKLRDECGPVSDNEMFLVEQMAQARWRLARIRRIEGALFTKMMDEGDPAEDGDSRIAAALLRNGPNALAVLQRYAAAAERSYYKAFREVQKWGPLADEDVPDKDTPDEDTSDKDSPAESFTSFLDRVTAPPIQPIRNEPNRDSVSASPCVSETPEPARPTGWRPAPGENLALHL